MNSVKSAYTALSVNARGVVLFAQHLARISLAGETSAAAFREFARSAAPGNYAVRATATGLDIQPRGPTALVEEMPVRYLVSPYANQLGPHEKPTPPSLYNQVRAPGIATLLTSSDGLEIFESCAAAVIAWDGTQLLAPPEDRPAVRSAAMAALSAAGLLSFQPLAVHSRFPLALLNAVGGMVVPDSGRAPFPANIRAQVEAVFLRATGR